MADLSDTVVYGDLNVNGDAIVGGSGTLEGGQSSPSGTDVLGYNGYFYATRVYNAVYNDIVDFQEVFDDIVYGKCYYYTKGGARICNKKCQKSILGIASDTYGIGIGARENTVPIAVAGWTLSFVDKEYVPGTLLTNGEDGNLVKMSFLKRIIYPDRIVAVYMKKEKDEFYGINNEIKVNNRHWVKVR